jgi:ribonucleotide monophosphatase NagD (HAD superfamily)
MLGPVQCLQGKRLVFVTNNSTKSRAGYLGKFTGLGLNVNAVSSSSSGSSSSSASSIITGSGSSNM